MLNNNNIITGRTIIIFLISFLFFLLSSSFISCQNNDLQQNSIFFYFPFQEDRFILKQNSYTPLLNCSCQGDITKVGQVVSVATCYVDTSNSIILKPNTAGYCNIMIDNVLTSEEFMYITDFIVSPFGISISPQIPDLAQLQLISQPNIPDVTIFSRLLGNSVQLRSLYIPTITSNIEVSSTNITFTLTKEKIQNLIDNLLYNDDNRYVRVDLEILLNGIVYSVTQPINLFKNPKITNVYPKLVRVNEATTILINSNPNPVNNEFGFTNTGSSLLVRFCQPSIIFNNVIYINSNQIKTTVTCPSQSTNSILEYSQDGGVSFIPVGTLPVFDISRASVTYTNAVGSSATGCSIFGKNKMNIQFNNVDAFSKVTTSNSVVELSLFSRQVNDQLGPNDIISCHWSSSNDYQLNCDCPILWDKSVNLPQDFVYNLKPVSVYSNDQLIIYSNTFNEQTSKIHYDLVDQISVKSPIATFAFDALNQTNLKIELSNMNVIYIQDQIIYNYYLTSTKDINDHNNIPLNCQWDALSLNDKVICDFSAYFLNDNSHTALNNISRLCGNNCTLFTKDGYDSDFNNCINSCNLYLIVSLNRNSSFFPSYFGPLTIPLTFTTFNTFNLIPIIKLNSITPDTILVENLLTMPVSINTNGVKTFVSSSSLFYNWVEETTTNRIYSGSVNYIDNYNLKLNAIDNNGIDLQNTQSGRFKLQLSMNGKTGVYGNDHSNIRLKILNKKDVVIKSFVQYKLNGTDPIPEGYDPNTVSPIETSFLIDGSGFPDSQSIKIKFVLPQTTVTNIQARSALIQRSKKQYRNLSQALPYYKRMIMSQYQTEQQNNVISFTGDCSYFSFTQLRCTSPNLLSSGISLPFSFNVSLSFDGGLSYFSPTKPDGNYASITVRASEQPIIVQAIPSRGPINPLEKSITVTLKGLIKDVISCSVKYVNPLNPIGVDISVNYTTTPNLENTDEFQCVIDTVSLKKQIDYYNANISTSSNTTITFPQKDTFKIILTTSTGLGSDAFTFEFYEHPRIINTYPTAINSQGKDFIIIEADRNGAMFDTSYNIVFKLGDFSTTDKYCQYAYGTDRHILNCSAPAHPDITASCSITYNSYQYMQCSQDIKVLACAAGYTAVEYTDDCKSCAAGQYKPLEGFFACINCEVGTYNNNTGQSKCETCPPFKTTLQQGSTNLLNCDCEKGYYRRNGSTPYDECIACPQGADCLGRGELPKPYPGYWWDDTASTDGRIILLKCDPPNEKIRCPGNLTLTGRCAEGYTGRLCTSCVKGTYYLSGDECKQCNQDVQLRFIIVVVVVVIIALVLFKFAQLKVTHLSSISIAVSYFQVIAVFTVYNFTWPESLHRALDVLKFFNLNLDIFVPECIEIITYGLKWGLTIAMPAIFCFLLIVVFGLECLRSLILSRVPYLRALRMHPKVVKCYELEGNFFVRQLKILRRDIVRNLLVPRSKRELLAFGDKFIHTFIVVVSFSYVFVITKAAEIFDCQSMIDGLGKVVHLYVGSSPDLYCFENDWWIYFAFALVTFLLFGLGTILLFAYIVYKKDQAVGNMKFYARFRFLFIRFRSGRLYWEIVIILRKLLISAAIIFFSNWPILVVLFTMFVIFISFILQTHHVPYRRVFHNVMEYIVLLSTEFLLFSGLLFYVDQFPDSWNADALGYLCILTVIISTVVIGILILLDFSSQYYADRRKQKEYDAQKKLQKENELNKFNNKHLMNLNNNNDTTTGDETTENTDTNQKHTVTFNDTTTVHGGTTTLVVNEQTTATNNNDTTIVIDTTAEQKPKSKKRHPFGENWKELPKKQRAKNFAKYCLDKFLEFLKSIEGEDLDTDIAEYDDEYLWDTERLDRGLPLIEYKERVEIDKKKDKNNQSVIDDNAITSTHVDEQKTTVISESILGEKTDNRNLVNEEDNNMIQLEDKKDLGFRKHQETMVTDIELEDVVVEKEMYKKDQETHEISKEEVLDIQEENEENEEELDQRFSTEDTESVDSTIVKSPTVKKGINPKTFNRLIGRTDSELSTPTGNSQQNLLSDTSSAASLTSNDDSKLQ
ncbi:hypothetical protein ABK040_014739 [Willaertia magna]